MLDKCSTDKNAVDLCAEVLCCDASSSDVSISWTVYGMNSTIDSCVHVRYKFARARGNSERFASAVEYARTVVSGSYKRLSCICYNMGPGSFTGLRNTLAFIKGIMAVCGDDLYVSGVRTHDAIAYAHYAAKHNESGDSNKSAYSLLVCTDARSKRYYAALYVQADSPAYCKTMIYDCSLADIVRLIAEHQSRRIVLAGNAAHELAHCLIDMPDIRDIQLASAEMPIIDTIDALRDIGLWYKEKNISRITELSEPLYVRGVV